MPSAQNELDRLIRDLLSGAGKQRLYAVEHLSQYKTTEAAKALLDVAMGIPRVVQNKNLHVLATHSLIKMFDGKLPTVIANILRQSPNKNIREHAEEASRNSDGVSTPAWAEALVGYVPQSRNDIDRFSNEAIKIGIKTPDGSIRWPSICPCCNGVPDTTFKIANSRTTGATTYEVKGYSVPYCRACLSHAKEARSLNLGCWVGGFIVVLPVLVLMLVLSEQSSPHTVAPTVNATTSQHNSPLFVILTLLLSVLTISALIGICVLSVRYSMKKQLQRIQTRKLKPSCCTDKLAVFYVQHLDGLDEIAFKNVGFLNEVSRLNATSGQTEIIEVGK